MAGTDTIKHGREFSRTFAGPGWQPETDQGVQDLCACKRPPGASWDTSPHIDEPASIEHILHVTSQADAEQSHASNWDLRHYSPKSSFSSSGVCEKSGTTRWAPALMRRARFGRFRP